MKIAKIKKKREEDLLEVILKANRKDARKPCKRLIGLSSEKNEGVVSPAVMQDISIRGVFVETTTPLSVGDRVKVEIQDYRASRPLALKGLVVWHREKFAANRLGNKDVGVGIRFEDSAEVASTRLKQIVDQTQMNGWFL